MRLTRKSDYALQAVIQLAVGQHASPERTNPVSISNISSAGNIPRDFAAKILKKLAYAGILESFSGKNGGYRLARPPQDISFREIIEAVEGPIIINRCLENSSDCAQAGFCQMLETWKGTQAELIKLLHGVKISKFIGSSLESSKIDY